MSVEKQFEIQMNNLPVEVQERILWCLRNDSVTLHRVERVCSLWADIVQFFEKYKSVRWRTIKVLQRLHTCETFNESMSANVVSGNRRCSSLIAERAEKVFITQMEIIRLKYPGTLHMLQSGQIQDGTFSLLMKASRDVILHGIGIFLPYGADLRGDIEVKVSLSQDQNLVSGREVTLPKSVIIENAKMCIDHRNGFPLKLNSQLFCYPGPGQINQHRKKKRQCLGLHTYPIDLQPNIELMANISYSLTLRMRYITTPSTLMETPLGGGGNTTCMGEDGTMFEFAKCPTSAGSLSVKRGQIPLLFYI